MTPRPLLIRGGTVVTMDSSIGDFRTGDVLITGDTITRVGARLEAPPNAEVIEAAGCVVLPGLVDAHRHMWYSAVRGSAMDQHIDELFDGLWAKVAAYYEPADLYTCTVASIAEALSNGVTTVLDWCHVINSPEHAASALRAYADHPFRVVFGYGPSMGRKLDERAGTLGRAQGWGAVRDVLGTGDTRLVAALQGPEYTSVEITREEMAAARDLGLAITMHVGVTAREPAGAVARLAEAGLLAPDVQLVHGCANTDEEWSLIASTGALAVACPTSELGLGMGMPPVAAMRDHGIPVALGADAVCTASGDLFDEARSALFAERGIRAGTADESVGSTELRAGWMPAREALAAVTINAARACWLEDRVGSLTPGKAADVIILDGLGPGLIPVNDAVGTVVGCAHGGNVDTVLASGRVVKRRGELVGIDLAALRDELYECRDRLFRRYPQGIVPPAA